MEYLIFSVRYFLKMRVCHGWVRDDRWQRVLAERIYLQWKKARVGNLSHLMRRVHGKSHLSRAVHIWMTESSERNIFVGWEKVGSNSHPMRMRPICRWQCTPAWQRTFGCRKQNFGFFPNLNRARVTPLLGSSGTLQIVLGVLYLCPQGPLRG